MGFFDRLRKWFRGLFKHKHLRVGIYGPPNAGKTTLANRISSDWKREFKGTVSAVPHETRHAQEFKEIVIDSEGNKVSFDIIDTPGVATKIDFHEFVEEHGLTEDESRDRARAATEGVIEAIRWLENVEGVILVMDSSMDPLTQVNVTILGNLQARKIPVIICANKIDLEESSPASLKAAFPDDPVVPVSALTGYNMESLYKTMVKYFG
jgi:small GTP-binding protein